MKAHSPHTIASNDLIANETQISKELMIMRLAIGQASLLVVPMTQEGLLTLGAHEMLHMPVLSQCSDNTFLNRSTTGTTNGNTHFIVAAKTIQFVLLKTRIYISILKYTYIPYNHLLTISFTARPGRLFTSRAVASNSVPQAEQLK